MKRKLLLLTTIISLILVCLTSCAENEPELPNNNITLSTVDALTKEYYVDETTKINIESTEKDALYGFYLENTGNQTRNTRGGGKFYLTKGGTYLYYANGDSLSFTASEIGLNGQGTLRMIKYNPLENDDYVIDTKNDTPLFINDKGERVFEEYYKIPVNFDNPEKVSIMTTQKNYSSVVMGNDIKIIKAGDRYFLPEEQRNGILDLTGIDEVTVFNQIRISDGNTKRGVLLQEPITINLNEEKSLRAPQVYEIKKTDEELVLEIKLEKALESNYNLYSSAINSRYSDGTRKPYVFPMKYDKNSNTILLYIGKVEKDFIFDFDMRAEIHENAGTATLRPITDEEKGLIHYIDPAKRKVEITYDENDYYVPIIFEGSEENLKGGYVRLTAIPNNNLHIRCSHDSGYGYTSITLDNGDILSPEIYDIEILECGYLLNRNGKSGKFTLQFSKDDIFPPPYEMIEFESPMSLKSNERYSILPDERELVLEINLGNNDFSNYDFRVNVIDSQYSDGTRRPYMFPLSYDKNTNTAVLYIGTVDKEFSFPLEMYTETNNAGGATLREITEEEKDKIKYVSPLDGNVEIKIEPENFYTPIIFYGDDSLLKGGIIKIDFSSEDYWIKIVSTNSNESTYTTSFKNKENVLDGRENPDYILEFAFLRNQDEREGTLNLVFSR